MSDAGERRTISRLAAEAGVNVETVRYYERRGLIRQPSTPSAGWRHYDDDTLRRLRFIKRAQRLGFSLEDVEELLALRGSRSAARCRETQQRAKHRLVEIERRIAELEAVRRALATLAGSCDSLEPGECPLLDALDAAAESHTHRD